MTPTESEVRVLLDRRSQAIRNRDIDGLMSLFAPDVVYFDMVPGLQHIGSVALRERFLGMFEGFRGPIGQELRDVNISVDGDLAIAFSLVRASGTRSNGVDVDYWVRATSGCRRSGDEWLIAHEHISVPIDFASGRAALDLVP
jgi:uncharacterized protein (TIGR02246 family)